MADITLMALPRLGLRSHQDLHYVILNPFGQGDADGYDLVVVDAMHKANYASRICHSCRPNCEAKLVFFISLFFTPPFYKTKVLSFLVA